MYFLEISVRQTVPDVFTKNDIIFFDTFYLEEWSYKGVNLYELFLIFSQKVLSLFTVCETNGLIPRNFIRF